jgi:hypothetical protein
MRSPLRNILLREEPHLAPETVGNHLFDHEYLHTQMAQLASMPDADFRQVCLPDDRRLEPRA